MLTLSLVTALAEMGHFAYLTPSFHICALGAVVGREATTRQCLKGEREKINNNKGEIQRYPEMSIPRTEAHNRGLGPDARGRGGLAEGK